MFQPLREVYDEFSGGDDDVGVGRPIDDVCGVHGLCQLQVGIGIGKPTGVPVLVDDDVTGL